MLMFASSVFLLLFSTSFASAAPAPAPSCPAPLTITVTVAASNVRVPGNTNSVPAPSATPPVFGKGVVYFGRCSTPEITFAARLNGRTETAFIPKNLSSFNHGSADNIKTITSFICGQLQTRCKANAAALDLCSKATAAANAATKDTGIQADEFNAVFGITTHFVDVPVVNSNGKTISGGTLATLAASNAMDRSATVTSTKTNGSNTKVKETATSSKQVAAAPPGNNQDQQSATTLNPKVIATGFAQNGQATKEAGQVPSLTSRNNFINFCLTTKLPLTDGKQIKTGSCNPAPMGIIASTNNMPSSKFVFPKNGGSVAAKKAFTIKMAIRNLETGHFVNAQANYYAAPQQVNARGDIIGHTHFVIERLSSLAQTAPTNAQNFVFFKGVNTAAVNGVVSAPVSAGLPPGAYRLASINAASNHQPVLVAVAQHGSLDDMVYFTVA